MYGSLHSHTNPWVTVFFLLSSCHLVNRDDGGLLETLLEASSVPCGVDSGDECGRTERSTGHR